MSSLLRSVTHCSWDTTGWFVILELPLTVFMMCSWLVETDYAIGGTGGSNKIVVIPASGQRAAFQRFLSLIVSSP